MLREVGNLYTRSFRLIFQHPQFLLMTAVYLIFTNVDRYSDTLLRSSGSLDLYIAVGLIKFPFSFCLYNGFPLALLLMSNQMESGISLKALFQKTKDYFWKYFRQTLAGGLLALAYAFLIVCLTFVFAGLNSATLVIIFLVLFFLGIGFLALGFITMGHRILLDGGQGSFQNSLRGLRLLNVNFSFFATLFFIDTLISTSLFPIRYALGSYITGVDLFSVPISDFPAFMKNVYYATQTPVVYVWDFLYGLIFWPFYTILHTLAYQRVKDPNRATVRQKLITGN
ncbi:MAG: hypothetical protein HY867_20165 [Chloroflexi bacterium]|nr:hypothetical protein [Chloroflexota bacterium]